MRTWDSGGSDGAYNGSGEWVCCAEKFTYQVLHVVVLIDN